MEGVFVTHVYSCARACTLPASEVFQACARVPSRHEFIHISIGKALADKDQYKVFDCNHGSKNCLACDLRWEKGECILVDIDCEFIEVEVQGLLSVWLAPSSITWLQIRSFLQHLECMSHKCLCNQYWRCSRIDAWCARGIGESWCGLTKRTSSMRGPLAIASCPSSPRNSLYRTNKSEYWICDVFIENKNVQTVCLPCHVLKSISFFVYSVMP